MVKQDYEQLSLFLGDCPVSRSAVPESKTNHRPEYWVLSFSGGKDSTALGLEWLTRHRANPATYPLDEVIFCDVGMDFPAMMDHVARLERIFTDAGIKFTRLKAEKSFEYLMFEYQTKKRNPELQHLKGKSWPTSRIRWCTGELKRDVLKRYFRKLDKTYTVIQLVGLAADELSRLEKKNNQNPDHRHPLIEWGWTESDCLKYCYAHGFDWGGLYEIFHRVSCWCCPLQSLQELRNLRKHFPDLWHRLLDMEHRTWNTFKEFYTVDQLEIRFQFEEKRLAAGLPINTREFHRALKEKIHLENWTSTLED